MGQWEQGRAVGCLGVYIGSVISVQVEMYRWARGRGRSAPGEEEEGEEEDEKEEKEEGKEEKEEDLSSSTTCWALQPSAPVPGDVGFGPGRTPKGCGIWPHFPSQGMWDSPSFPVPRDLGFSLIPCP